jgi:hypothetical protein
MRASQSFRGAALGADATEDARHHVVVAHEAALQLEHRQRQAWQLFIGHRAAEVVAQQHQPRAHDPVPP